MGSAERDEAAAGALGEPLPDVELPAHTPWRQELGHSFAPVGDLDFLTRLHLADVVAEAVLQLPQADPLHPANVAS